MKKRSKRGENYINNADFSDAVAEHVRGVREDKAAGKEPRQISDYIAESFMKITNGLSRSPNFINYTYREDMVMDAVENCIKAIANYDIDKPTRTGKPNSFSYFTQISYFAFLRRIAKEKKQSDIKKRLIDSNDTSLFADFDGDDMKIGTSMVEGLRQIEEQFYDDELCTKSDEPLPEKPKKKSAKKKVAKKRSAKKVATDLNNFLK